MPHPAVDVSLLLPEAGAGTGGDTSAALRGAWCAVADAWRATGLRGTEVTAPQAAPPGSLLVVADAGADLGAVLAHDGPVLLAGPALPLLVPPAAARALGVDVQGAGLTPPHEVRVRPGPAVGEVALRVDGDLLVPAARVLRCTPAADVEVHLTANVAFCDHPAAWSRHDERGRVRAATLLGRTPADAGDPAVARVLVRLVRHLLGRRDAAPTRVGMLGYGAIGHEHNAAGRGRHSGPGAGGGLRPGARGGSRRRAP